MLPRSVGKRHATYTHGPVTPRLLGTALTSRLRKHAKSIGATETLRPRDFVFRHLVLDNIRTPLGKDVLIETSKPLWNVALEDFGINDPPWQRDKDHRNRLS